MNDVSGERGEMGEREGERFLEVRNNCGQEMGFGTWKIEEEKALIGGRIVPNHIEKYEG